jgi:pilus assembly protein CpaB
MTRRITAITVAIVLAAFGAAGGLFLIFTADQRAQDRLADGITVAVASSNIGVGTSGARIQAEKLIKLVRFPKANVPDDALTDFGDGYAKLVLQSNVAANQMLLKGNFAEASHVTSGLALDDGKIAITIPTGAPAQSASYIRAGSQVVIFYTYNQASPNGAVQQVTKVLIPKVQILAVTPGGNGLLITVGVNQADAERLIESVNHGSLYLGLLTDSADVHQDNGVNNQSNP